MDRRLSEFIAQTRADPGLAQDLLASKNWDMEAAVLAYRHLQSTNPATLAAVQTDSSPSPVRSNPLTGGGGSPAKPPLSKALAVDLEDKKLKRGISKTTENMLLVSKARNLVLSDIHESSEDHSQHFVETPEFTFILPDLTIYSEDFRAFLEKDLIETSTMVSLEQVGRLNWWAETGMCQRLWPMATSGDGNCLLHAASLGMWGFHDRLLTLRKALYVTLTHGDSKGELQRRWRYHQTQVNKQSGLVYSEAEWREEWENLIKLSSAKPRLHGGSVQSCCHSPATNGLMQREKEEDNTDVFYESLEEFHVFVLAHVLRRPIVVVADTILKNSSGEALAPIPFGGIYLPIECEAAKCHQSPLVLTYDASHFSALVAMEQDSSPDDKPSAPAVIPLVDPDLKLLPLHFAVDPGTDVNWNILTSNESPDHFQLTSEQRLAFLNKYLNIEKIPVNKSNASQNQEGGVTLEGGLLLEPRSRSNSNSGSYESDEGTNSTSSSENGGKLREDKQKNRVARQMQTVAKQFGSIGKTMGKKIKKNFGSIGKSMKVQNEVNSLRVDRQRKGSVGSVTQSTKVRAAGLDEKSEVFAAKLSYRRAEYQEEMISNYLHAAQERFKVDRELKRQKGIELRQKAEARLSWQNPPSTCINPGCEFKATAATSYLCSVCYDKQKAQAMNFTRLPPSGQTVNYTRPPPSGQTTNYSRASALSSDELYSDPVVAPDTQVRIALQRQTTVSNAGKSKFYTLPEEDQCLAGSSLTTVKPTSSSPLNNYRSLPRNLDNNTMELANSKFYTKGAPKNTNLPSGILYINNDTSRSPKSTDPRSKTVNKTSATNATVNKAATSNITVNKSAASNTTVNKAATSNITVNKSSASNTTVNKSSASNTTVNKSVASNTIVNKTAATNTTVGRSNNVTLNDATTHSSPSRQRALGSRERDVNGLPGGEATTTTVWQGGEVIRRQCKTHNCAFFGSEETDFLCSACYKQKQRTLAYLANTRQTRL